MLAYDSNRQNACVSSAWWIKIIAWWRTNCRWSVMELSHLLACVNAYTRVRVSLKGWIVRLIQSTLCCYVMLFFGERIVRYSAVSWCKLLNERTMFRCAYLVAYRLSSIRVTHATWSRDKCDNVNCNLYRGWTSDANQTCLNALGGLWRDTKQMKRIQDSRIPKQRYIFLSYLFISFSLDCFSWTRLSRREKNRARLRIDEETRDGKREKRKRTQF